MNLKISNNHKLSIFFYPRPDTILSTLISCKINELQSVIWQFINDQWLADYVYLEYKILTLQREEKWTISWNRILEHSMRRTAHASPDFYCEHKYVECEGRYQI